MVFILTKRHVKDVISEIDGQIYDLTNVILYQSNRLLHFIETRVESGCTNDLELLLVMEEVKSQQKSIAMQSRHMELLHDELSKLLELHDLLPNAQ